MKGEPFFSYRLFKQVVVKDIYYRHLATMPFLHSLRIPMMSSEELRRLQGRVEDVVRRWGMRILLSKLRAACRRKAISQDDVMLLLEDLVELVS